MPLQRQLTARHLQMIVIGGTIGTGLFLGSGQTIATAGPAGALVAFSLVGTLVYCIVSCLGEMAACLPIPGSFNAYALRFVDPALGFGLGWNYYIQWAISLPSELSALGIIAQFWLPHLSPWVISLSALALLLLFNLSFGVGGFGESEYWLSILKVLAVVFFLLVGLCLDLGVTGNAVGFQNWFIPDAPFKNGFKGLFDVFLIAFFAFGGTELVGMTAAETLDPQKTLPKAVSQTLYRISLFYIASIAIMGLLIPHDDPRLLDPNVRDSIALSPFTLVFSMAGIPGADHLMNAVVFSAILSAANSAMYAASRTLLGLSLAGHAPRVCSIVMRGVPVVSLAVTVVFGSFAFLGSIYGSKLYFL